MTAPSRKRLIVQLAQGHGGREREKRRREEKKKSGKKDDARVASHLSGVIGFGTRWVAREGGSSRTCRVTRQIRRRIRHWRIHHGQVSRHRHCLLASPPGADRRNIVVNRICDAGGQRSWGVRKVLRCVRKESLNGADRL